MTERNEDRADEDKMTVRNEDRPAEVETIVSLTLFFVTVVAGICLGTHFIRPEREPEIIIQRPICPTNIELHRALIQERQAKEEALDRLSAIMSSRIRDGNSDIVDLSDPNRPEKIGEKFSELYDNQWTDAYVALDDKFNNNEHKVIEFLFGILQLCFKTCQQYAEKELGRLRDVVTSLEANITKKHTRLSGDLMQRIKEEIKLSSTDKIPEHDKISELKKFFSSKGLDKGFMKKADINAYIQECLRVCRLMVIQDPPMTLLFYPEANVIDHFRPYQAKGTQIDIVVWPALYLKDSGPLVKQGIIKFLK